jgi:glutamate-1-semialdehyde 2,1-aminomutase
MDRDFQQFSRSIDLRSKSKRYLAGGVSSAMRAAAKPVPLFFTSGSGSKLVDVDGNTYIDYTLAWGPLILGHSHSSIAAGVGAQLKMCHALGAQCELEPLVARRICEMVPCADRIVFSNTGTEAVQIALRLARAFTGKRKIIRFEGHYHGWLDDVLVGYRPAPMSNNDSADQVENPANTPPHDMLVLEWNNLEQVESVLKARHEEIAGIITEPILCNCNCLMPEKNYLVGLRQLADQYGIVLIFDEVITGFRVARGGAQELFGVKPDLATFGKAVAGGFALSVVAGIDKIMSLIERQLVVHAGTFNGNPISLAAANATLEIIGANGGRVLSDIDRRGVKLINGIRSLAASTAIPILVNGVGSAFHLAFTSRQEMLNYQDTLQASSAARDVFVQEMLKSGVYLLPDGRWYVSGAHSDEDVDFTLTKVAAVFEQNTELLQSRTPQVEISASANMLQKA